MIKGTYFEKVVFNKAPTLEEIRENRKVDLLIDGIYDFVKYRKGPNYDKKYENEIRSLGGLLE